LPAQKDVDRAGIYLVPAFLSDIIRIVEESWDPATDLAIYGVDREVKTAKL
jgi:hypothetical protein